MMLTIQGFCEVSPDPPLPLVIASLQPHTLPPWVPVQAVRETHT